LSQKYTPLWPQGKKTLWDPSMCYRTGSYPYSLGRLPITIHYLGMSRLLTTGEWSVKSSGSGNSNTTYRTSTSELPILRLSFEECHRLNPLQKGGWSSPTSTITCPTSMSLAPPSLVEEGEIIMPIRSSGGAWNCSR
jgi:hypothetical protein